MQGKSYLMGLVLIWIAHLSVDFMLGVWTVYKTIIQMDLVIAGLIASLAFFIGEGMQLFFGILSDKGHHRTLLILGLGLTATIPFLSYVENAWILLIMVLSAFIGSGAFHPSASGLVLKSPVHQSILIAIFACGGMVGAAMSQWMYTFIYFHLDGQTWVLALPILSILLACLFYPFQGNLKSERKMSLRNSLNALHPFRFKLGLLYGIHVGLQIIVLSFQFLLPDILKIKGYEQWFCLGGGFSIFILGSVLSSIPIGYCVSKVGYRSVLAGIIMLSASSLYAFLAVETMSIIPTMILLLLLGASMGVVIPVVVAGGIEGIPEYTRSLVCALFMGGTTCIAGFGPLISSLIAYQVSGYVPIFALQCLSSLFIITLFLIYYIPDTSHIRDTESIELESSLQGAVR